ncbi:MAG: hypothetical protein OXB84_00400, partial [Halobacteriovoraceae bacterium]|nr:hypothetical protein [Halobacteriovoraceae bacterium]
MDVEKKKIYSKGQALIELLVFFPFLILLIIAMLKLASAINGSINQQKAVRSYFFYLKIGRASCR